MGVELPKDAEGREIPLDTKVLYNSGGDAYEVACYVYAVRQTISRRIWDAKMLDGTIRYTTSLYLTPPDSWEKLEEDLQRITADPTEWFCMYAGHDKRDTGCHSNCSDCKFFKDNRSCEKQAVLDIVFRIRKLRGED